MAGPPNKRQKREGKQDDKMPQKKFYRQRAHANPFSDHDLTYPAAPELMDWSQHFPAYFPPPNGTTKTPTLTTTTTSSSPPRVEIADIGCGFGGLLFALAPLYPNTLLLGLEIRSSVASYVREKTHALRSQYLLQHQQQTSPRTTTATTTTPPPSEESLDLTHHYQNTSPLRANTMKFLPNLFPRATLAKIFLCFPDPHFKARKHKARIVSRTLNSEYAYVLGPGGKVYTITDVEDLHLWMVGHFEGHEMFERVGEGEEVEGDECVRVMREATEEGKKVERNGGRKFVAVFRRVEDPGWPVV